MVLKQLKYDDMHEILIAEHGVNEWASPLAREAIREGDEDDADIEAVPADSPKDIQTVHQTATTLTLDLE